MNSLWAIIGVAATGLFGLIGLFAWILPRRAKLKKETEQHILRIEKEAKEANENIKVLERHFGVPIYADGLPSALPPVFDPFAKGLKLMTEYKWNEAIAEFKQSMKEAKASQLVALYNFIGLCYYRQDKLDSALENYNKSLSLAIEFSDKKGEASALHYLGLIFMNRGDLNEALKYSEDALKIDRELGDKLWEMIVLGLHSSIFASKGDFDKAQEYLDRIREGMAIAPGNLGVPFPIGGYLDLSKRYVEDLTKSTEESTRKMRMAEQLVELGKLYQTKGDFDKAIQYYENLLKIFRGMGNKNIEGSTLFVVGFIFETKGEREKALRYFEDALIIFTQIGAQKEIEKVKENIKRLKGE
jgi:tetratricopeptide (TPR) repeat protein